MARSLSLLAFCCVARSQAHIQFRDELPNSLHVPNSVAIGHNSKNGGGAPNFFGQAFRKSDFKWTKELCKEDSDGDGISNGHELGDSCCIWKPGDVPSRTYGISHPGDMHCSTAVPMPVTCDHPAQAIDIVAAEDENFYKFYYTSRKEQLQTSTAVNSTYETMTAVSKKAKHYCGASSEAEMALDQVRNGTGSDVLCGVCAKCCGGTFAQNQEACDICVAHNCTHKNRCPTIKGGFQKSCKKCDWNNKDCLLECECKDAFGLPVHTTCNTLYCHEGPNTDAPVDDVILTNHFGHLACGQYATSFNYCKATYNYTNANYRMLPPSAYAPSLLNLEGALAWVFGSYKASDEISGDANKAVANFPASLVVFVSIAAILAVDGCWIFQNCLTKPNVVLFVAATFVVDLFSGVLHIVLDNPNFVQMPIIGPQCTSFQTHHDSPTRLLIVPWFGYLSEHHAILAIVMATVIGNHKSRSLRVFLAYGAAMSELMMASHRWSHTHPLQLPWLVRILGKVGVLMPVRMHSYHHVTYDCNFCIFTGWFNPLLNFCTWIVHPYSRIWLFALISMCFLPLILSFGLTQRHLASLSSPLWKRLKSRYVAVQPEAKDFSA